MSSKTLHILCAGACQSLFNQIRPHLPPIPIQVDFGPVGRLSDQLRAGRAADIVVSSRRALGPLVNDGHIDEASIQAVGHVPTSVAAISGSAGTSFPEAHDTRQFASALMGAAHLYLPDTKRSTAGTHMLALFELLGVAQALRPRLHELPNGAAAIAKMVEDGFAAAIGFAQRTEIVATPGAVAIGNLPEGHTLVTEYCCALTPGSSTDPQAITFLDLFRQTNSRDLRRPLGFVDADLPI